MSRCVTAYMDSSSSVQQTLSNDDVVTNYYICCPDLPSATLSNDGLALSNDGVALSNDGVAHYEYNPYGVIISSTGTLKNEMKFRFSSKYWDDETGLGYWGYRFYSPELGRWVSRDPINERGGLNIYLYVNNNTLNEIDVIGMWSKKTLDPNDHVWIAERGDTLESLAKGYGDAGNSSQCLWPVNGTKDHGYPNVSPCDEYDASNLAIPAPNATSYKVVLDEGLVEGNRSVFGEMNLEMGNVVHRRLWTRSGEGATPIQDFIMSGHSGYSGRWPTEIGVWNDFSFEALESLNLPPSFSRATQRKGPLRCWFARNATVRINGCSTLDTATKFANKVLRKGAVAYGTTQSISTTDGGFWYGFDDKSVAHSFTKDLYDPVLWKKIDGTL